GQCRSWSGWKYALMSPDRCASGRTPPCPGWARRAMLAPTARPRHQDRRRASARGRRGRARRSGQAQRLFQPPSRLDEPGCYLALEERLLETKGRHGAVQGEGLLEPAKRDGDPVNLRAPVAPTMAVT